jgi:hypothetical protein
MKRDLYSEVTARIVAELERGAAPWIRPGSATADQNVPRGATPRILTYKQAIGRVWTVDPFGPPFNAASLDFSCNSFEES